MVNFFLTTPYFNEKDVRHFTVRYITVYHLYHYITFCFQGLCGGQNGAGNKQCKNKYPHGVVFVVIAIVLVLRLKIPDRNEKKMESVSQFSSERFFWIEIQFSISFSRQITALTSSRSNLRFINFTYKE